MNKEIILCTHIYIKNKIKLVHVHVYLFRCIILIAFCRFLFESCLGLQICYLLCLYDEYY